MGRKPRVKKKELKELLEEAQAQIDGDGEGAEEDEDAGETDGNVDDEGVVLDRPKHYTEYKYWKDLGADRTFLSVATHFKRSVTTIKNWAEKEQWAAFIETDLLQDFVEDARLHMLSYDDQNIVLLKELTESAITMMRQAKAGTNKSAGPAMKAILEARRSLFAESNAGAQKTIQKHAGKTIEELMRVADQKAADWLRLREQL